MAHHLSTWFDLICISFFIFVSMPIWLFASLLAFLLDHLFSIDYLSITSLTYITYYEKYSHYSFLMRPLKIFTEAGVVSIEHADFDGIERLAAVTGGEIASTFDRPDLSTLGECKLIDEIMVSTVNRSTYWCVCILYYFWTIHKSLTLTGSVSLYFTFKFRSAFSCS